MGKHTICEEILQGPCRARDGVTQTVLPISDLAECGAAHIEIPKELQEDFGGKMLARLESAKDADSIEYQAAPLRAAIHSSWPQLKQTTSRIRRVDWEWNNWHYDILQGLTDSENYDLEETVTPAMRIGRANQTFYCSISFPIGFHGGTVVKPWAGKYAGQAVQAPPNYAVIFDPHAVYHRGDRWLGSPRGVFMLSLLAEPPLKSTLD